jgi:hypothetical protein
MMLDDRTWIDFARGYIKCPYERTDGCTEVLPVVIEATYTDDGDFEVRPNLTDIWAHVWIHWPKEALDAIERGDPNVG